jgi:AraC-like DNA-binding protein
MEQRETKIGRPQKTFDWALFDHLCATQCTLEEMATALNVSADTIERRVSEKFGATFAEIFQQKRKAGFASLRSKQFEVAMSGNVAMLIWLGKQYLGQSDKQLQKTDVTVRAEPQLSHEEIRRILSEDPFR